LLSFNLGVELGQILVLVVLVAACELLFRFTFSERVGVILLSALVAHTGWHWMIERGSQLKQFHYAWPAWNAAFLAAVARWMAIAVAIAGAMWLARNWRTLRHSARRTD
jgi:hypothetical protein